MTTLATTTTTTTAPHAEELTTAEWARLLVMAGLSRNDSAARRLVRGVGAATHQVVVGGQFTHVIPFAALPAGWRVALEELLAERSARTFAGLLSAQRPDWQAPVKISAIGDAARKAAVQRREAMAAFFGILERGGKYDEAVVAALHRYESLTGKRVSKTTLHYWSVRVRDAIGPCGRFADAPLEAFARWNAQPHEGMQLINRLRRIVPDSVAGNAYDFAAFLAEFRSLLTEPGIEMVSAAHTRLDMRWRGGEAIAGLGRSTIPGHPLPFTAAQLRALAPSKAMRVVAAQGKFRALADSRVARLRLSSTETPLLAEVQFDDTRADFVCRRDSDGAPVTLRLYVAIEAATRMILAWTVKRHGSFTAADTAALLARAARNAGLAHPHADYKTLYKIERGVVAMPNERRDLLLAMYPDQLRIERTGMVGGTNLPGDFAQEGKGRFWQKGIVEAFNKAFGYLSRWIPGQRGSDWRKMPAMLGTHGERRDGSGALSISAGSQIAQARDSAAVAHLLAVMDGECALDARAEEIRCGGSTPMLFESDAIEAIAEIVHWHNSAPRAHRMEGEWEDVWIERSGGGRSKLREAPAQKWQRLCSALTAHGLAPQRITEEQAALWLLRSQEVTCTADGIFVLGRRYFAPGSKAIHAAMRADNGRAKFLALLDDQMTDCLWILDNSRRDRRKDGSVEDVRLLEVLPLVAQPQRTDRAAVADAARATRAQMDGVLYELAKASPPRLARADAGKMDMLKRVLGTFSRVVNSNPDEALSNVAAMLAAARMKPAEPSADAAQDGGDDVIEVAPGVPTRREVADEAALLLERMLAEYAAQTH